MDNSIVIEIVENFTTALWALPVMILGLWLSTKSWTLYPIVMVGAAWMAFVIASGPVYGLWINPDIRMDVKTMAWTIPPIFFTILNMGSILTVQAMKGEKNEGNR